MKEDTHMEAALGAIPVGVGVWALGMLRWGQLGRLCARP